jgi:ABC-type branched-subunit amino acid transport system substrate-binding protein
VSASTITLGNITTINGPVPGLFAGSRYGAQAVADYINSLGGVCGRKVVVTSADDQFDQATDQNEAATMAPNILAFLGSFTLQDEGIPAGAPNVPDIGESLSAQRNASPMNFSPSPNPDGYVTGPFIYLKSQQQYAAATQHMALLVENTPQTITQGQILGNALKSVGYNFTFTDENLQPTDPTFNGDVQKMKAAGVTGVVFEATGTIIGQLANAMYQAGINVVLGDYCAAAYDPAYIKNAGPGVQGTILEQTLAMYDGEDAAAIPMVATLDQWYSRVNPGQVPDLYATYAWMSGLLMAQAINSQGSVSRQSLLAGLQGITNFDGDGLSAPANPAGKQPPQCWILIDVKNGKFVRDPATPSGFRCSPTGYWRS